VVFPPFSLAPNLRFVPLKKYRGKTANPLFGGKFELPHLKSLGSRAKKGRGYHFIHLHVFQEASVKDPHREEASC
jgi:hypothetical protein